MKELIKELKFWEMSHKLKSMDREDLQTIINKMEKQLNIPVVSCSFTDKEVLSNSIRFALKETPKDEQGALNDFKKYQGLMRKCMRWLKDNYEPCDGFMNEVEV